MLDSAMLGVRRALPVVCGYLPVGFAFGVLVVQNGMPAWLAILTSVLVYAGSAQLIAAGMLGAGVAPLSIIATTFVVNLRHLLMSTALAPWMSGLSRRVLALIGFELTDESFALHSRSQQLGEAPDPARMLACNITAHLGWITGTALGALSGELLGDTRPFGLDFTLVAMFIALLVPQCREQLYCLIGVFAAGLSVALTLAGAGRWAVVGTTLIAACLGGYLLGRRQTRGPKTAPCLDEPTSQYMPRQDMSGQDIGQGLAGQDIPEQDVPKKDLLDQNLGQSLTNQKLPQKLTHERTQDLPGAHAPDLTDTRS